MRKIIFTILFVLTAGFLFAQENKSITINTIQADDTELTRNVFHFPRFLDGKVLFKDNVSVDAKLNYHRLFGQLLFINPKNDTLALANPEMFKYVTVGTDTFYFHDKGFVYLHSPIITASDAEGAGETFHVTALDLENPAKNEDGSINYKEDFFGRSTNLTVSGQLEGELAALALGDVYTFGPTFRAENSNTARHLAEFWMIEPEMAFSDLEDNMNIAEEFIKYIIKYALDNNREDLDFLAARLVEEDKQKPQSERSEMGLIEKLEFVINNEFERLTYTEAIEILKTSTPNKKKKFQFLIDKWGVDLQSEHERYLVEKHFKKPVILTNYPKEIKSFYMRQNDDGKTVAAMDILAPGIGEIVGGSQREERLDVLESRMKEMNIPSDELYWYLDTRKFGSVPHAGFGLGFERLLLFVTGMTNIRDVVPFPRFPKNAEF